MNSNFEYSILAILFVTCIITACGSSEPTLVGSTGISTKDLSAEIHVTNNQDKIIDVEVMLRTGNISTGIDINLDNGDTLFASSAPNYSSVVIGDNQFEDINASIENKKALAHADGRSSAFFQSHKKWYYSNFPVSQTNPLYTIFLERQNYLSADNSTVQLPAPYNIISPVAGEVLSRSADIIITWDNFDLLDIIQVSTSLTCSNGLTTDWRTDDIFNSTGVFTIPVNTFSAAAGICSISVRIDKRSLGQLDPAFTRGGIIIGHQLRTVVISTTP